MKQKKKQTDSPYQTHAAYAVPLTVTVHQYRTASENDASSQQETVYMTEAAVSQSLDTYRTKQKHIQQKRSTQKRHQHHRMGKPRRKTTTTKATKMKSTGKMISAKSGLLRMVVILIGALLLVVLLFFICVIPLLMPLAAGGGMEETEITEQYEESTEPIGEISNHE